MKMQSFTATLRQQMEAGCKLDVATCLRQAKRGRQVAANLKELGYGV